ncbi:FGFR, partial [Symbiodinium sp. KB8]
VMAAKKRPGVQDKPRKPKVAHSPERSPAFDLEGKRATPEAAQRQAVAATPSSSKEADYDVFLPVQVPAAAAAGACSAPTPEAPVSSGLLQPALSISDFVATRGLYGSLGSEATQAASGKEQEPVPFVRRLLSSSTGSEGILPPQPRKLAQGPAAKPSAVARERSVADWSASRYFPSSRPVEDDVNFSVYAPSAIAQGGAAPLDVWAFVRAQEAAVRERATAKGSTQRGTASRLLRVGRGDLVTVLLRVDGSPFEVADEREEGGGCRRTFTWVGSRPCTVRFWVKARRAAPVGAHPVCIRIIVGTQVLDVDAFLTVSSQKGVAAAAALAAASLVRAHRAQERLMKSSGKDGCAFQLSQFRELAARGRFVVPAFGDAEQTMHDVGMSAASQALGQESVSLDTVTPAGPVESSWLKTHMSMVDACVVEVRWEDLQHERTLGAGAHGEAWLASVSGDSARVLAGVPEYRNLLAADGTARVVVKSPKIPPSSGGDHVVRGFKHEVAVASFLGHHPNIVMQVGACTEAAVHAKGLAASASGPAPPPTHRERLGWCRDVATGLANMHSNNILHCDVATRNVLLTATGQAKLCDLGLARHLGAVDAIDLDSYGPWRLMAPEVLQSPAIFSRASDVYGFGTFMWEVFSSTRKTPEGYTGQVLPWTGLKRDTREAMMLQVYSEHGQRVRLEPSHNWVSPALAQLQQRCVSFSYATALPPVDVSLDDGWSSLELPPAGTQKRTTNSGIAFHTAFQGSQCDTHIRPTMAHVAGLLDSMLGQVPVDS